ncbi:MAG: GAF domain-containing protein [Anaerolineales bacterium]|nr:GAF domain-containing protein [Anaerolineales bacterium]MCZ2120850.1 GAF domain-containing protein [Anaerolineales bacterium]
MAQEDKNKALLELLIGVSREVASALDLRTVLQRLLFAVLQNVGGERASIMVIDDTGKPVDATIIYGKQFHEHTTQQLKETIERGLAGWVVKNRKAALIKDTSQDERWLRRADDEIERTGAKSAICVPLISRKQLVGVLTLVHSTPNVFDQTHLELMQAIADQASIAVLNARLYSESQRTARVMSALAEGAETMNSSLELQEVWRKILHQTMQALQVETVALALIDHLDADLVFHAAAGGNSANISGRRIARGQGLAGLVIQNGRGLVVPNVSVDTRYGEADQFKGIEMRAIAIVPIQSQGKPIGVLEAINPLSGAFDPDALLVMAGLGSLAGSAIQNAQFLEQVKNAHSRYRELFEDSVDPILITDWEGKILEANRQAVALSGFTNEQLHALSIDQLHQVNWDKTGAKFSTLKQKNCVYESTLHLQNGGALPVEVHARRVEFNEIASAQWILRDISERKELDALRDDMTAMIYHDLRSPLGNIVSSLDMMSTLLPNKDNTLHAMLTIAANSTGRIQRLINSLLDISRLEAGHQIVEQQAIDPLVLMNEAVRDVQPNATARTQTLEKKANSVLPLIWVDVDMIHRVLINLLENAIKFTPVEGRIEIGATTNGQSVKFWIRDNGPGIPEADRERIFEKFTRLRGGSRTTGLGVGLAFCRLAVIGHGGQIWLDSEPNQGTTFWLTLPVAQKKTTGQIKRQTGRLTIKPTFTDPQQ